MAFTAYSYMNFTLSGDLTSGTLTAGTSIIQPQDPTFVESPGSVDNTFQEGETYTDDILIGDWIYRGYYDGAPVGRLFLFQSTTNSANYIFASLDDATTSSTDPTPGDWPDTVPAAALVKSDLAHCFAAGTGIATPDGETAVETLKIGDIIATADGRVVPVTWIGRQTIYKQFWRERAQLVCISAGALNNHSNLCVTADHGMIVDGLVINASALVNGRSIDWVPLAETPDRFTVYHIETENHDVILANGTPAETFIDYAGRKAFDNYAEYVELYGAERIIPEMDRPRISARRLLPDAIRARLGIVEPEIDWDSALSA